MPAKQKKPKHNPFVQVFHFKHDKTKEGRLLSSVKIGDVYMSRLTIKPGIITGNYFRKKNMLMFYVESGNVFSVCEHAQSKERKEFHLKPGEQVVHVPPMVSLATKNIGKTTAILVFFSTRPIRDETDYFSYVVMGNVET
ncbi:MAG: hypothetical protein HYY51_03600 [Candidatus Magasanikbacteria bacterium]|nr:hypothetical protein [Candidatus Magasanikbacteria bacterium]